MSRRFYQIILFPSRKRTIIGLCEYVRVSKMRNITRAKMPNLGAAIWRTILNFYASQGVCLNYCYHIYQHLLNFTYAFKCYQKCKLASL